MWALQLTGINAGVSQTHRIFTQPVRSAPSSLPETVEKSSDCQRRPPLRPSEAAGQARLTAQAWQTFLKEDEDKAQKKRPKFRRSF